MQVSEWTTERLSDLHPFALNVRVDDGRPVSWTVSIPTTRADAERFLRGESNERELTDTAVPRDRYEALYLCAAFTDPEYRGKGYATELFRESIDAIPLSDEALIFAWIWSDEGGFLVKKLERLTGRTIRIRK